MIWTEVERCKDPRRARSDGSSRCPAFSSLMAHLALMLLIAGLHSARAQAFGRFGLALKTGAAAGPMGVQLAWNLSPHYQLCAGGGGTGDLLSVIDRGNSGNAFRRTDSYFMMGKYYLDHLFFETGYALKVAKSEHIQSERARIATRTQHAIPIHVGYEFGHRRGFYFAASAGYFLGVGGHADAGYPDLDPAALTGLSSVDSGPTVGLSVGYYLY